MKKLLFLLFLIPISAYAAGPVFEHEQPEIQREFQELYKESKENTEAIHSGSSIVSFASGAVTGTWTLKTAATEANHAVRYSQLNIGKILQVVTTSTNTTLTQKTSASGSYVTTGLAVSITPTSATSKILVLVMENFGASGVAGTVCTARVTRATTDILIPGDYHVFIDDSATESDSGVFLMAFDSPATTSSIQYSTRFARSAGTGTCITNTSFGAVGGNGAYMVLLEIGQ